MSAESSGGWLRGAQPSTSESEKQLLAAPYSNGKAPPDAVGGLPVAAPASVAASAGTATPSESAGPAHVAPPVRALPGGGEHRRHTLIAVVLDKPGVLNRVSSLMRARNFNIDSLAVSHTDHRGAPPWTSEGVMLFTTEGANSGEEETR